MSKITNESKANITVEEKRLLDMFRKLTPEQRRKVITVARRLIEPEPTD